MTKDMKTALIVGLSIAAVGAVLCGVALALLLSLFNGAAIRRKINSLNRVRR